MSSKPKASNGVEDAATAAGKAAEQTAAVTQQAQNATAKAYDDMVKLNRQGIETAVQKASSAVKCLEAINTEILDYAKHSIEDGVEASRAMLGVRSVQDFVDLHTRYSRTVMERFVDCSTRLNDMMIGATKQTIEPFAGALFKSAGVRP